MVMHCEIGASGTPVYPDIVDFLVDDVRSDEVLLSTLIHTEGQGRLAPQGQSMLRHGLCTRSGHGRNTLSRWCETRGIRGLKREAQMKEKCDKVAAPPAQKDMPFSSAYLHPYACFSCRKSFKRATRTTAVLPCPQCGGPSIGL